jgi:hypothetical protein
MRAASPTVSFSLCSLSSATRSIESWLLRHARATRLAAAYLLFTVALVMVPNADFPETFFDEANTPTNEFVVEKAASAWEHRSSVIASVPRIFAQPLTDVRGMLPVYAGRLTNSCTFREFICSLLC